MCRKLPAIIILSFLSFSVIFPFSALWAVESATDMPSEDNLHFLTLREAIEQTLKNNVTIAVEEFNSKIRAQDIIDRKSEFDPSVAIELSTGEQKRQASGAFSSPDESRARDHAWDLSLKQKVITGGDYEINFNNARDKTNSAFAGLNPQYSSELILSATQPLLKNFGFDNNKRNIYIANNDQDISEFEFEGKVIDTVTAMENVYWELVFSIEDLNVKKKSLKRAQDLEKRVRAQVEVGTVAPLEILQAQSEVASREELLLQAEDLIQDNEDNLKNILNINFDSPTGLKKMVPADKPQFKPEEENYLNEPIKEALKNRPDYLSRKTTLANENILVKYNENQVYPSVDLFGSLGLNGISGDAVPITTGTITGTSRFGGGYDTALNNTISKDYYQWEVGLKLSYPLGNRSAKSKLTASRLKVAQTLLDIKDLEKKIVVEVREAVRQIKTESKRVQATRIARKLAEEKLNAEEKKLEVGLSTSFEVLQFQEDLVAEQSNEIRALIDYNKSKTRLRQVLATTLDSNNIKVASKTDS
ncbi:MAG: TolC family protein [Nitrospinae bacterium]|nr:TolC family protein [Nitrospinota bacterium]MDA1108366.1 TolC family protein [Nitrospinota bacterium]